MGQGAPQRKPWVVPLELDSARRLASFSAERYSLLKVSATRGLPST
jgi:hypothetical protein